MNLSFTEEQEILQKSAHDFLVGKLTKKTIREIEESELGYSQEIWRRWRSLVGWGCLSLRNTVGRG